MKRTAIKYAAIAILPLAILLYKPLIPMVVLTLGERVMIETLPLDPREFLRGDYVNLDYSISGIPMRLADPDIAEHVSDLYEIAPRGGLTAYVSLARNAGGLSEATRVSLKRPASGSYIRGKISYIPWEASSDSIIRIDYGLGVYYIKEGTGRAYEDAIREGAVVADVRIWRGIPVLKELIIER